MPGTYDDYPASMKNLTPQVRHKAIDMANAMLEEGYPEGRAIAIATAQAQKWAQRRDQPITQDESGKTGQALKPPSPEENQPPLHVVFNSSEERWVVRQDKKELLKLKKKETCCIKRESKPKHNGMWFTFTMNRETSPTKKTTLERLLSYWPVRGIGVR